jgi:hypothetical protein
MLLIEKHSRDIRLKKPDLFNLMCELIFVNKIISNQKLQYETLSFRSVSSEFKITVFHLAFYTQWLG